MMMGRPSALTPERHQAIVGAVKRGMSPERAAQATGVHPATYYGWMARGHTDLTDNHPDPASYTLAQLRALAADQDIDITYLGRRPSKARVSALVVIPTRYSEFYEDVKRSDAQGEDYALAQAIRTGGEQWTFWMTLLERRFPERWARMTGENAGRDIAAAQGGAVSPETALEAGRARLKVVQGGAG